MHRLPLFLSRYNNHYIARHHGGALYTTFASAVSASSSYIVVGNGPIGSSIAKHLVQLLASADNNKTDNNKNVTTTTPKVTIIDGKRVGIGSSHADRARLIRTFDAEGDDGWTKWNIRSLQSFPDIEKKWQSSSLSLEGPNKSFFTKCGALLIGDEEFVRRSKNAADKAMMLSSSAAAGKLQQMTEKTPSSITKPMMMSPIECQKKWPFLKPKVECDVALFDSLGGIIDPNAFIEAQNTITAAASASAVAVAGTSRNVTTIDDDNDHEAIVHNNVDFEIISDEVIKVGRNMVELASTRKILYADKVIVCGGSYTKPLLKNSGYCEKSSSWETIRSSKRTVALLEVSSDLVKGILKDMPSIKYAFDLNSNLNLNNEKMMPIPQRGTATATATAGEQNRVEAGSVYIIPPVWYPGERERGKGKWFIKIGGGDNKWIDTKNEIDNWLFNNKSGGGDDDDDDGDTILSVSRLEDILRSLMPDIQFESIESMACVTTVDSNSSQQSNGVVVDDDNIDDGIIAVSACQGKGAGPAEAVSKDIAYKIYHNQINDAK
jgi:glycine/D-amino acid oxidase-like deaminating enzyme